MKHRISCVFPRKRLPASFAPARSTHSARYRSPSSVSTLPSGPETLEAQGYTGIDRHHMDDRRDLVGGHAIGQRAALMDFPFVAAPHRTQHPKVHYRAGFRLYHIVAQRKGTIKTDARLAAYVTNRLTEGWTPEQVAGRLRLGVELGLRAVCAETIYDWIYRAGQKTERLWRFLTRHHARRRTRHGRTSRDTIAEKTHISLRPDDVNARETVEHWEADLVICKRS
jgi:hypothetical protein